MEEPALNPGLFFLIHFLGAKNTPFFPTQMNSIPLPPVRVTEGAKDETQSWLKLTFYLGLELTRVMITKLKWQGNVSNNGIVLCFVYMYMWEGGVKSLHIKPGLMLSLVLIKYLS